jgi:hypothetical protein
MSIRTVAGVDPGKSSAAIALYGYRESSRPRLITTAEIPTFPDGKRIDWFWLQDWCQKWQPSIAYIENATAMGEGTVSGYLKAAGAIEAAISLSGVDSVYIMPADWKRALGLLKADKKQSVILARELFPEHADSLFKHWNSHNIAEAACLAAYGASRCDLIQLRAAA